MLAARFAVVALAVLAFASSADAGYGPAPAQPQNLRPFLLLPTEPPVHSFPRTPSFAWNPVRNAINYEFELSTSPAFNEGTIVYASSTLKTPAVSIPAALPWLTGNPYGLYAHVRAISPRGAASEWSATYAFNMQWANRPTKMPGTEYPGLVRWTPVSGASAYDVWFVDIGKVIRTRTTVADEREYYTFHQASPWPDIVHWRVRAVRKTYGSLPNMLPTVTYGPWSPVQTSLNPAFTDAPLKQSAAISDTTSTDETPDAHALTPGFAFSGDEALTGKVAELYRVYVFSDSDCVNVVFKGALVGSPAYAPRLTGPLALPALSADVTKARNNALADGLEGKTFMADGATVTTSELDKVAAPTDPTGGTPTDPDATAPPPESTAPLPGTPKETGAAVDLWDSGWPNGRYYWTVVPAEVRLLPDTQTFLVGSVSAGSTTITLPRTEGFAANVGIAIGTGSTLDFATVASITGNTLTLKAPLMHNHPAGEAVAVPTDAVEYHELETPQDACATGRIQAFGKVSQPSVTTSGAPYVTGLSPQGRLVQAAISRPSFYGSPLVAWKPALGADEYEVQWSQTRYPWRPVDPLTKERYDKLTYSTSTLLDHEVTSVTGPTRGPLPAGTWWYRVRGIDFSLPGTARAMSWSAPVPLVIAAPTFTVGK